MVDDGAGMATQVLALSWVRRSAGQSPLGQGTDPSTHPCWSDTKVTEAAAKPAGAAEPAGPCPVVAGDEAAVAAGAAVVDCREVAGEDAGVPLLPHPASRRVQPIGTSSGRESHRRRSPVMSGVLPAVPPPLAQGISVIQEPARSAPVDSRS